MNRTIGNVVLHLALDEHRHVHEHVVELLDRLLELHDVVMPRLNVLQ